MDPVCLRARSGWLAHVLIATLHFVGTLWRCPNCTSVVKDEECFVLGCPTYGKDLHSSGTTAEV